MRHRFALGAVFFLSTSCIGGGAPPSGSTAPTTASSATDSGQCGQFKIKSSSDLDSCKGKCRDQERDQMQACSGPNCQAGAGTAACLGNCDAGQKAAQQANCYK
jgi:hypothetical protein